MFAKSPIFLLYAAIVALTALGGCTNETTANEKSEAEEPGTWWEAGGGTMTTFQTTDGSWAQTEDSFFPPDEAYPRFALSAGQEAYADLDAERIKRDILALAGISLKSLNDGNQYWGRITGTEYDHLATQWVSEQFAQIGLDDVRTQDFDLPTQWYPASWEVVVSDGNQAIPLTSAYPWWGSPDLAETLSLEATWVGLGTAADFLGRDVRGKAVFLYSVPTPGGLNHSVRWSSAVERARSEGAAAVFMILGIPGNVSAHPTGMAPPPWNELTFSLGVEDGMAVRQLIESGQIPEVRINLEVEARDGLHTQNVWGTLPGAGDENILVMAHTDGFFQGALDNASGVAMLLELARHYAALPRDQRRRNMTFVTTPAHHAPLPDGGIHWIRDNMDAYFEKTALIVNCEHIATSSTYMIGPNLVGSNAIAARRWYVQGSDELEAIVGKAFRMFGVTTYARPATNSGGELAILRKNAPGFHALSDILYHTELDIPELVPAAGIEATVRAYAKIIDDVNKVELDQLRSNVTP
jgi:hypothetical protein